jgi:hypothetical protein
LLLRFGGHRAPFARRTSFLSNRPSCSAAHEEKNNFAVPGADSIQPIVLIDENPRRTEATKTD